MTVPMKIAVSPRNQDSWTVVIAGDQNPRAAIPKTTATSPKDGKIAVRPVLLTALPVIIEPSPTPMVMGSSSMPIPADDAPGTTQTGRASCRAGGGQDV